MGCLRSYSCAGLAEDPIWQWPLYHGRTWYQLACVLETRYSYSTPEFSHRSWTNLADQPKPPGPSATYIPTCLCTAFKRARHKTFRQYTPPLYSYHTQAPASVSTSHTKPKTPIFTRLIPCFISATKAKVFVPS